jgi:hypothetical protein
MNKPSITTASDPDLRLSEQALLRAAQRAREVARQTGTAIVVRRGGRTETLRPEPTDTMPPREPAKPHGDGT